VRAVLDPNVHIAALLSPAGPPAGALRAWQAGRFELIVSPLLLGELRRALAYPKLRRRIPEFRARAYVSAVERRASVTPDPGTPPRLQSADADDDYLIALAESRRAALVSGDADLLALAGRLPVFDPRGFLEWLAARDP
jgi:putative PIN family toxin of toxin-antitoxin system